MFKTFEFILCLLASYGVFMLLQSAASMVKGRGAGKLQDVRLVLLVRNVEESIEHIVRTVVKKEFLSMIQSDRSLVIIDLNSSDRTRELLEKIQQQYANVEVLTESEKEFIFQEPAVFSPPPK